MATILRKISEAKSEDKKYSRMSMYYSRPMNITVTATWQGIMHDESVMYEDSIEKISDYYSPSNITISSKKYTKLNLSHIPALYEMKRRVQNYASKQIFRFEDAESKPKNM